MMKRGLLVLMAALLFVIPTLARAEKSAQTSEVSFAIGTLTQGQTAIAQVTGSDLVEVRAMFQERTFFFYPENGHWVGLISADHDFNGGPYTLQIWVRHADDSTEVIPQDVTVLLGGYATSEILVPASLSDLLDPDINDAEFERLFNIMNRFTPDRYWVGGFAMPNPSPLSAWFGTSRLYNGTYWSWHTGVDVSVGTGTPVLAAANGRIMLAGAQVIRGNYIMIDHGWGVYSGYAHLSEFMVVPGQWVHKGDVIGLSGMTGRTSGAHIHMEMAVGGVWTDPESFLALGLDINENQ
jgi:murein DD-endopeptidase MepM/ murein hydrolase activator NlpD